MPPARVGVPAAPAAPLGPRFAGVDWSDTTHRIVLIDEEGAILARLTIPATPEGGDALRAFLGAHAPIAGVAIEATRRLILEALVAMGMTVYPIHPKQAAKWREELCSSGAKDDGRDAWSLADGLRHHRKRLRAYHPEPPEAQEFRLRCEDEMRRIHRRTQLLHELKDGLKQYHPEVLVWFPDLTTRVAWDFIAAFPTPQALAEAPPRRLLTFFKTHKRSYTQARQDLATQRAHALAWGAPEPVVKAKADLALALVKELYAVQANLLRARKRIQELYETHPDRPVAESLPGAADQLEPRLALMLSAAHHEADGAGSLQRLGGTVPVTIRSGKTRTVKMRRSCRKGWRQTLHQWAEKTLSTSRWAKAYYDWARAHGQHHALALRNLASKWLRILYRIAQTGEAYDEERYVRHLLEKNVSYMAALNQEEAGG